MRFQSLYGSGILTAEDKRRLAPALSAGLTCSEHSLTGGGRRHYFIDLPRVLTHPDSASLIVNMLTDYIRQLQQTTQIDRLAFVDISSRGPSGLVPCQVAISLATKVPGVTIRPEKRLFNSQVVGDLRPNDRVLFLCDVLTTGQTLAHAYAIVARHQAEPVHALFVYEGDSGRANLEAVGIRTSSFMRKDDFLANAGGLRESDEKAIREPEPWNCTDLLPALVAQI